jgi:hypothetical protein
VNLSFAIDANEGFSICVMSNFVNHPDVNNTYLNLSPPWILRQFLSTIMLSNNNIPHIICNTFSNLLMSVPPYLRVLVDGYISPNMNGEQLYAVSNTKLGYPNEKPRIGYCMPYPHLNVDFILCPRLQASRNLDKTKMKKKLHTETQRYWDNPNMEMMSWVTY